MDAQRESELIKLARQKASSVRSSARGESSSQRHHRGGTPTLGPEHLPAQYELVRELHRGGQGVVYLARQKSPARLVAIKIMREGPFAGPRDQMRFQREVRILATLRHPNIVTIHESSTAGGFFYYVMDHIEGTPLDRYVASRLGRALPAGDRGLIAADSRLDGAGTASKAQTEEILKLFVTIAEAVNAAHVRGVIHRDLKPGNVLIDSNGVPHVLDFGLARMAGEDASIASDGTRTGQFVGSPPWASPEQAEGRHDALDIRSDVYSLGVMLFQALCGRFPYRVVGNMREVIDNIVHASPPRLTRLIRGLNADIDTIVQKCLSKEPERRYQSAGELAADIRRCLAGEPIDARRASTMYVLTKTVARHRLAASLIGALLITIAATSVLMTWLWRTAETRRSETAQHAEELRRQQYFGSIALASAALENANTREVLARLNACPGDLRGWEWRYLHGISDGSIFTISGHQLRSGATFNHAGDRLITFSFDRSMVVWTFPELQMLRRFTLDAGVCHVAISPDDSHALAGAQSYRLAPWISFDEDSVRYLRPGTGRVRVWNTAYSPDGRLMAGSMTSGQVVVWDAQTSRQIWRFTADCRVNQGLAFSRDGRIVTGGNEGMIRVWDIAEERQIAELAGHTGRIICVDVSADGRYLVSSAWDSTIRVYDAETYELRHVLRSGIERPLTLHISPDSTTVAACFDQTIRTWDLETGIEGRSFIGLQGRILTLAYAPDGRHITAGDTSGDVKVWPTQAPARPLKLAGLRGNGEAIAFSPDARRVVCGSGSGVFRVWERDSGALQIAPESGESGFRKISFSADGNRILGIGNDGALRAWDATTGLRTAIMRGESHYTTLAVRLEDDLLALGRADGTIEVHRGNHWELLREFKAHERGVTDLEFAAGKLASSERRRACVWDAATLSLQCEISALPSDVRDIALSPDGALLATSGGNQAAVDADDELHVWDARSGAHLHHLLGHKGATTAVAFSPDGTRLASGCIGQLVNIYEPWSGSLIVSLRGHQGGVQSMCFSSDGEALASAGQEATAIVWDSAKVQSSRHIVFKPPAPATQPQPAALEPVDSLLPVD